MQPELNALAPEGCGQCHLSEVKGFARSAMAHSTRLAGREPEGKVEVPGTTITMFTSPAGAWQQQESGGETSKYRVAYVIGSGRHASGYLIDIGNHLFQSPVAYYKSQRAYGLAPGYEGKADPDFTRPVTQGCVFCHAGSSTHIAGTQNDYQSPPLPHPIITCNRCHGPSAAHLDDPRSGTIINPAKLEGAARDSICEQCHLIGVARVLNPGKKFSDFTAGQTLESTFTIYRNQMPPGTEATFKVISHAEQLALSMCARKSNGRLWCGTCHDPHNEPIQPIQYYRARCLTCHAGKFNSGHPGAESDCIGCHMPKRNAANGGHTAFTDHRIQRLPAAEHEMSEDIDISAWRDPAPELQKRNLGIAYIQAGMERHSAKFIVKGYRLLTEVQGQFSNDSDLYTWIGEALLLGRQYVEAEQAFGRAVMLDPTSPEREANLAQAYASEGKLDAAALQLQKVLDSDPLELQAATLLMDIYKKQGETEKAQELSERIHAAMQ